MFIDRETITIKAGNGGDGITSFIRYKGVANGGPDGGDGGRGGNVYFIGDKHKVSLIDYEFKKKYVAENGGKGGNKKCHGKDGEDLVLPVPLGTIIRDKESGRIICDIFYDGEKKLVLSGGRGGKGNVHFCTSRRHAPHFSQKGETTDIKRIQLELKVIADVGIIGFPNAGKSTLLSKISGAKPKIANYHFTTLSPNLGVVSHYEDSFVVADIPGLIEGASKGAGLGHDFLRHIERTRLLVHVVDISEIEGRKAYDDFIKINKELGGYSEELIKRKQIIVANKCDMDYDGEKLKEFKRKLKGEKVYAISALNGENLQELLDAVYAELQELPPLKPFEFEEFSYEVKNDDEFEVQKDSDGCYYVYGPLCDLLERNVVLDDMDSLAYMQKTLRDKGVIKELKRKGIVNGDTVVIGEIEFEFID